MRGRRSPPACAYLVDTLIPVRPSTPSAYPSRPPVLAHPPIRLICLTFAATAAHGTRLISSSPLTLPYFRRSPSIRSVLFPLSPLPLTFKRSRVQFSALRPRYAVWLTRRLYLSNELADFWAM